MTGLKAKYIKTSDNQIIVFPAGMQHKQFQHFNPITAGHIHFYKDEKMDGGVNCECYGDSFTLGLKADKIVDSALARLQIIDA